MKQTHNSKEKKSKRFEFRDSNFEFFAEWNSAGWYPVPDEDLPIELPYIDNYKPGDDGVAPLAKVDSFYTVSCPACGAEARRETDVSDTFLDSAWYFLRYPSVGLSVISDQLSVKTKKNKKVISNRQQTTDNRQFPWNPEVTRRWLPVDMYTGGAEHSVLHLLYSRFVTMALHDMGHIDFEEPFTTFFAHGLVIKDGTKMSKSKGNVVNPDEYIDTYGIDALRMYLMFMGPFSEGGDFRDSAMEGMSRFINRVYRLMNKSQISNFKVQSFEKKNTRDSNHQLPATSYLEIDRALHKLIKKVGDDLEQRKYNTAIAAMMEFVNLVRAEGENISSDQLKTLTLLLAPFAPMLADHMWQVLHGRETVEKKDDSVHSQSWPAYDETQLVSDTVQIVIQVNGRLRDTIEVRAIEAKDEKHLIELAKSQGKVEKYLKTGTLSNTIFVPGKLINFVVGN